MHWDACLALWYLLGTATAQVSYKDMVFSLRDTWNKIKSLEKECGGERKQ